VSLPDFQLWGIVRMVERSKTNYALSMKTRDEISAAAKHLQDTFTGFGSTSAVGRTEMKMMVLQMEVLLDIREAILNLTPDKE
jgi:hypothetical protein